MPTTTKDCTCEENPHTCAYCSDFPDETTPEEREEYEELLNEAFGSSE